MILHLIPFTCCFDEIDSLVLNVNFVSEKIEACKEGTLIKLVTYII